MLFWFASTFGTSTDLEVPENAGQSGMVWYDFR